jgi:hypothetical protein
MERYRLFLGYMNSFSGSLSNTIFSNAAQLNKKIYEYWKWYYTLIDSAGNQGDEWLKYVAFKMPSYGTTMQVKTYDLCSNGNQIIYPFIFREILIDQGKYSWADKSKNNTVKYPLKKILEKYVNKEFVHRRKVGLNSSLEDWMLYIDNKYFLIEYLNKDNSIAEIMIGRKNLQQLKKAFLKPKHHIMITNLIVSMANIQSWCDEHKVNP